MNFQSNLARATRDELMGARFTSRNLDHLSSGRVFWVIKTTKTNYAAFVKDHPDYQSADGVVTVAAVYNTVDAAIGACTAAQGDIIYVCEGHTETVTATSIAHDISGVSVIGLGKGLLRPTFTYGAAAATITISGANGSWENCYFIGNFDNVAAAFTLGAAKDFTLKECDFIDNTAALHFMSIVVTGATDNDADGLTVIDNHWDGLALAPDAFISILAAERRVRIVGNDVNMAATNDVGHFLTVAAKVQTDIRIKWNTLTVVGATGATVGVFMTGSSTTNTGIMSDNYCASLDATTELFHTAALGLACFNNRYTGALTAQGYLLPAVDA